MRSNNFDFLRLLAASAVIVGHVRVLHGGFVDTGNLSTAAVFIFFAISGFLVTGSWENDPNLLRFLVRRALRILPGLFIVVCVAAFIIGPLATSLPYKEYFANPSVRFYLQTAVLSPVSYALPGVFAKNPYQLAVNGSLWTLPPEAAMYILLAVLGTLGILKGRLSISVVAVLCIAIAMWMWGHPVARNYNGMDVDATAQFGVCFAQGVLIWKWRDRIPLYSSSWVPVVVAIAWLSPTGLPEHLIMSFGIPYATLAFALKPLPVVRSFGRFGDFSYGIYIYGFLIEQSLMNFWPSIGTGMFLVLSLGLAMAAGATSWHLVERPAISLKQLIKLTGAPDRSVRLGMISR